MANSTTNIDNVIQSQSSKEITINAYFDAASPATVYGRRGATSSGLTWGYYGGNIILTPGSVSVITNGTIALTASTTNYIEADQTTGAVSENTSGFTPGAVKLYSVVTGSSTVTSWTDYRCALNPISVMGGDTFSLTIQTVSGTTKTLANTDLGCWIRFTGAATVLTIPLNATVSITTGKYFMGVQGGTGQVTFTPEGGVTINKPSGYEAKTRAQGSPWALTKVDTNVWDLTGDLEATP